MKTALLAALTASAFALPQLVLAEDTPDTNGDGMLSLEEAQAAYVDVTEESFAQMDSDADGSLSEAEVIAALEAGLLKQEG